jgi:hypothetical protein
MIVLHQYSALLDLTTFSNTTEMVTFIVSKNGMEEKFLVYKGEPQAIVFNTSFTSVLMKHCRTRLPLLPGLEGCFHWLLP